MCKRTLRIFAAFLLACASLAVPGCLRTPGPAAPGDRPLLVNRPPALAALLDQLAKTPYPAERLSGVFLLPLSMSSGVVAVYRSRRNQIVVARLPEGIGSRGDLRPVELKEVVELAPFLLPTSELAVRDLRFAALKGVEPTLEFDIDARTPHDPSRTSSFLVHCRFRFARTLEPLICLLEQGELRTMTPCYSERVRVRRLRTAVQKDTLEVVFMRSLLHVQDEDECRTGAKRFERRGERRYRWRWNPEKRRYEDAKRLTR